MNFLFLFFIITVWHHDEAQSVPEADSEVEAADPSDFDDEDNLDSEDPDFARLDIIWLDYLF